MPLPNAMAGVRLLVQPSSRSNEAKQRNLCKLTTLRRAVTSIWLDCRDENPSSPKIIIPKHVLMRLLFVSSFVIYRKRRLSKTQDAGLMKEKDTQSFVRRIERLLFLSTGPNEENFVADTEQALNRRLHQLLGTVLSRRILQEQESGANRLREFERVLGANTVQDISALCREIERVKLERAKMGYGSCYKDGVCTIKGRDAYPDFTLRGKMPKPVRNLFFCTRLLDLWNCETNSVHRFTVKEWNELYVEAVQNLKMYRECMSQQKEQDV
jgi:hypothetical protein